MKFNIVALLSVVALPLSMSMASGGKQTFSALLNKPEVLSHLSNEKSAKFVPLLGTYDFDDHYKPLPREKVATAKTILSRIADDDNHDRHRELEIFPGHLMDILVGECSSEDIYQHTTYDDQYEPECGCYQDEVTGVILVQCYLGDESCEAPTDGSDIRDVCTGTYEIFLFGEDNGKLSSKITCTVCRSDNCHGVLETCIEVAFDDDHEAQECQVIQLPTDNNESGVACGDCIICDQGGKKGIQHNCFGNPNPDGCDTDAFAHLHNFATIPAGTTPIGGLFGDVCSAESPDLGLYSLVTYQAGLDVLCDCEDPSSAVIFCDLYLSACFANTCTETSELFFFEEDGSYEGKWTIDWETLLWTETLFDSVTGVATSCSVLQWDPNSNQTMQCHNCQICESLQDGTGIKFDCFGVQQDTKCDATNGRAKYNFELPEAPPSPPDQPPVIDAPGPLPTDVPGPLSTKPPAPAATPVSAQSKATEDEESTGSNLGIVLGALFGGMAFALLVVVIVQNVQRKTPVAVSPGSSTLSGGQATVAPAPQEFAPPTEPDIEGAGDMENVPLPDVANENDLTDEEGVSSGFLA